MPDHPTPSVLQPAGPLAQALADVAIVVLIGGAVIFIIVLVIAIDALRGRHRERPRQPSLGKPASPAPPDFAWRWLFGGGAVFPVVVLSALLVYATWQTARFATGGRAIAADPDTLLVTIDGRMWWWEVRYRMPGSGREELVTANEIRLPAGRPIRLVLTASDVIHSFWVPALAGKVDMLPGRIHHLELADLPAGRHRGLCAEFCGEQHARMALEVVVEPAERFDAWLAAQRRPARAPDPAGATDQTLTRGLAVFRETRCDACHTIRGLTGRADAGPDLTHVGSRRLIGAGTLANDAAGLERWLVDLQRIKSGARMPSYERLSAEDRHALARFLESLR